MKGDEGHVENIRNMQMTMALTRMRDFRVFPSPLGAGNRVIPIAKDRDKRSERCTN